jgi:hypothetical protein
MMKIYPESFRPKSSFVKLIPGVVRLRRLLRGLGGRHGGLVLLVRADPQVADLRQGHFGRVYFSNFVDKNCKKTHLMWFDGVEFDLRVNSWRRKFRLILLRPLTVSL